MTTPFKELSGSPCESFGPKGMKAQRQFLCAWNDRRSLVQDLLGDGYELGGHSPAMYPDFSNLVAVRIEVEPFLDDLVSQDLTLLTEGLNAYQGFAKLTVHYEIQVPVSGLQLVQSTPENTYLTYQRDLDYETVTLGGSNLRWLGNPTLTFPTSAEGVLKIPVTIHRLTWNRVVSPPWGAIGDCQGALNQAAFLGVEAGKLLFDGVKAEREFLSIPDLANPQFSWRLEYQFREKPLAGIASQPIFRSGDFSKLLLLE